MSCLLLDIHTYYFQNTLPFAMSRWESHSMEPAVAIKSSMDWNQWTSESSRPQTCLFALTRLTATSKTTQNIFINPPIFNYFESRN